MGETSARSNHEALAAGSTDYARFIIVSAARTGSHMLAAALNSSPNILCFREVLNDTLDFIQYGVEGYDDFSAEDMALRRDDPLRFLDERIFCQHPKEIRAVGFKFHYGHVYCFPGTVERMAADKELRVLHLRRWNMLQALVSLKFAEKTGIWLREEPPEPTQDSVLTATRAGALKALRLPLRASRKVMRLLRPPKPPDDNPPVRVTISAEELTLFSIRTDMNATRFDELLGDHPKLTLFYEDILAQREHAYTEVQQFLGIEPQPLSDVTHRQRPEPLRALLENYDELYEAMRSRPYADYYTAFFD
jgi:hypothetical protein